MSWMIKMASADKERLKAAVDSATAQAHGMPKYFGDAIKASIDAATPEPGTLMVLESNGHVGSLLDSYTGNNGSFSLKTLFVA